MLERNAKECTGKECTGTATLVRTGNPSHAEALLQPSRPTWLWECLRTPPPRTLFALSSKKVILF